MHKCECSLSTLIIILFSNAAAAAAKCKEKMKCLTKPKVHLPMDPTGSIIEQHDRRIQITCDYNL